MGRHADFDQGDYRVTRLGWSVKILCAGAACATLCAPAFAGTELVAATQIAQPRAIMPQLAPNSRERYREVFAAIRSSQWSEASVKLDAMDNGPLHNVARAELYLAKGSPAVSGDALAGLARKAPELPQAASLARLAASRGVIDLPALPSAQELTWLGSAPRRSRLARTDGSATLAGRVNPLIKDNRPNEAEAVVEAAATTLNPESLTEWRQRVAWSYYIVGEDDNARRVGALAQSGAGEWAAMGDWVVGLAAWRRQDYAAAASAFASTARRAPDGDMVAAGHFWAARALMAAGQPQGVNTHLKAAAQNAETFYGMLSLQRLGLKASPADPEGLGSVERLPNVRAALALSEIGEMTLADQIIRHQARIGQARDHAALATLAGRLELPNTQLWLAHNGPAGATSAITARYPLPRTWQPEGGWRVDKALVFAHALQESQFRTNVTSPAGARGLMQVRPGTASDIARSRGQQLGSLSNPATNLEYGQSYIEMIRDMPATGGMLPKVIAAYNAGPTPVATWNDRTRDNADPLLFIESISYWETRAYVTIIMRNYWMYQHQIGEKTDSLAALSQGMWPRFPGMPGATAVRLDRVGGVARAD
jgi:soluble lytic murein transglycosylase